MDSDSKIILLWPYGVEGADSIPFSFAFLTPQLMKICHVITVDCSLMNMPPDSQAFENILLQINPEFVGISVWSQNARIINATMETIRRLLPNAIIITGGPHVSAVNHAGEADYAIAGEAEFSFPALLEQLLAGDTGTLDAIPGVRYSGQSVISPRAIIDDLDSIGMPNYDAMFLREYQQRGYHYRNGEKMQAPILATRGCPYDCGFCEAPIISGRIIRKHSLDYLRELLKRLKYKYDVTHVNIVDDNFTFDRKHVKAFCEMVLTDNDFRGFTFATPNGIRVERSDREMFQMMKRAGWSRVIFAPESGSQRLVSEMNKRLNLDIIPERVAWAHEAGLEVEAFFILNYPGETEEDILQTVAFVSRVPFDDISLHVFKPLPHTPIWRELVDSGQLSPDYIVGRYDQADWFANGRTSDDVVFTARSYISAHLMQKDSQK